MQVWHHHSPLGVQAGVDWIFRERNGKGGLHQGAAGAYRPDREIWLAD
ncbi:MAG: hypothetical protein H7836_15750 [Magnetococcus sp. YQC-3]